MKNFLLTKSLRLNLLIELILSFIITLLYIFIFSRPVLYSYCRENRNDSDIAFYNYLVLILFILGIGIFIICFLLMSNRHIKYIKYITNEIKLIASSNLGQTLEVRGNDELAELCININLMSKELKDKFEYERRLEREKSELITNVSHDLRTPLTPIIAYLDILKSEKFNTKEQANEYINSSYNLSIKLKMLIDELFEYTKLSNNGVVLELVEVDICPILNQIIGEYTPLLENKEIKVITTIPNDELLVKIDIEKIIRVFDNILSNTEKYISKSSDIIISVENTIDNIVISFSNKGEYIPQYNLDNMFEKFYRVDTSRSSSIEGSGLGLAISKKIIELHNGDIWADCDGDIITFKIKLQLLK